MLKKTTVCVYNLDMSIFVQPTAAPTPRTKNVPRVAIIYAVILVVMAVAQLFSFDEFLQLVTDFGLPGGVRAGHFFAAIIVTVDVFALPFLLRMPLSPAFRWVSIVCGWLVSAIWIYIAVWLIVKEGIVANIGFLGTVVPIVPDFSTLLIGIAFGILAGWASWGMWPRKQLPKQG